MRKMVIRIENAKNVFWLLCYYCIICLVYIFWISPNYAYEGFVFSISIPVLILSIIAVIFLSFAVSRLIENGKMSEIMLAMLSLLYFYPQIVLCTFCLNDVAYFLFVSLYAAGLFVCEKFVNLNERKRIRLKERANLFEAIIVAVGLMMILISGVYSGFRISFNLSDYYEYRFEVREMVIPTILKYVMNWARTLLPIGLVYSLIKKKYWLVIFVTVAQILCFSFDGKKSSLFLFIFALTVSFVYKAVYKRYIPFLMFLMGGCSLLESALRSGATFIGKHIIRRMMFVPGYLGWAYFDYFQDHELDYLKSSVLRRFGFKSTYSESIPRLIGRLYYNSSSTGAVNANTGLCGDAFSNFGWLSLLFYPLINILIFKIFQKYTEGLDERLKIVVCLVVVYAFLSGSFFTVLLTNGILLLILLLIVMPRQN